MDTEEKTTTQTVLPDHKYDAMLPVSLFCGLAGMLLSPLPAVLCALITGKIFYPLFAAAPLLILLFTILLKAGRNTRVLIVTAIFSLAGAYLTALSCQASLYVKSYGMTVTSVPFVTILSIGKSGVLPASASAYVYPLLFTALGVAIAREFIIYKSSAS